MMARGLSSFVRETRAAAAAEMALILPMAFALIFTTMEAGYYFQTEHKAVKYVREGARYASRQHFDNFDCSGTGALAASADATTAAARIRNVTLTGQVEGGRPRIADWEAGDINVNISCDDGYGTGLYSETNNVKAPVVSVSTRFGYTPILGLLGFDIRQTQVVARAQTAVMGL